MTTLLVSERRDDVLLLTITDPATRNAIDGEDLYAAFEATVAQANADLGIRAVVLTGDGPTFSSGGNVRQMMDRDGMFSGSADQIAAQYRTGIQRIPRAMWSLDVPAIAAVNGAAIGAGCDLACLCDIRIASDRAVFAESFVRVGLVAGDGGAWLLPRLVGYSRAAEMAFTAAVVDADEAYRIGLVSRVVPHDRLLQSALDLADLVAANPPQVVRWTKRLMRESFTASLTSVLDMAAAYQGMAHHTRDHAEALAATKAKRRPIFMGC